MTTYTVTISENDLKTQDRFSTTKDIKKRPHGDGEEEKRYGPVRTSTLRALTHKWGEYHHHRGPPEEQGSRPHFRLPS